MQMRMLCLQGVVSVRAQEDLYVPPVIKYMYSMIIRHDIKT